MFTNLVLACGYGVVGLTAMHVIVGNWSGIASLGNFGAAFFALAFLMVRAWMVAVTWDDVRAVELSLGSGAAVNAAHEGGGTALHHAVRMEHGPTSLLILSL